eukprot:scaffold5685_cov109-Skeletonema_dohrnii-CCMP3373.AAC.1
MMKYNINATHVVLVPHDMKQSLQDVIALWVGEENRRFVVKDEIVGKVSSKSGIWKGIFNKLWAFNLTEFEKMLSRLPHLKGYDANRDYDSDPMTSGYGQQAFVTTFFLGGVQKNATDDRRKRCVMPTESAFQPWIYETVHFTVDKPWRRNTHPDHPFVCSMLREWNESMQGVEKYYDLVPPIENDYLQNCGNRSSSSSSSRVAPEQEGEGTAPKNDAQVKAKNKLSSSSPPLLVSSGEQCIFCEGGIVNLVLLVPDTGGNTCGSIQSMAFEHVNGSGTCSIIQKAESVCCLEIV